MRRGALIRLGMICLALIHQRLQNSLAGYPKLLFIINIFLLFLYLIGFLACWQTSLLQLSDEGYRNWSRKEADGCLPEEPGICVGPFLPLAFERGRVFWRDGDRWCCVRLTDAHVPHLRRARETKSHVIYFFDIYVYI